MPEPLTFEEMQITLKKFGVSDYVVFTAILTGCAFTGIYNAFRKKKNSDGSNDYLVNGKNMKTFPVALSLIASYVSSVTLLETPTETYLYGTEYAFIVFSIFLSGFFVSYFILPVFHDMQLFSIYEYLEKRFDKSVRLFGFLMYIISQLSWLPVVIYVPALALNQVTGEDMDILKPAVCLFCVFYTFMGGLRGIIWIDASFVWFMIVPLVLICIKGSIDVGGFEEVINKNYESGRITTPTFKIDTALCYTFWNITFGGIIKHIQESFINQNLHQKYLSLSSLQNARNALWIFVFGTSGLLIICSYAGLIIYATYSDCDPLTTKLAKTKAQVLPLLVMKLFSDFPGFAGFFSAGIFSATLSIGCFIICSSLSTGLYATSTVVVEDIIKTYIEKKLTKKTNTVLIRGVIILFGAILLSIVLLVKKLETTLQFSISLSSIFNGPIFGIFFCGMFLPWINEKGALFGGLLGLVGGAFVILGAQNAVSTEKFTCITKPTSVEGCHYYYNSSVLTSMSSTLNRNRIAFPLFKISYIWYTAIGGLLTIVLALIISAVTGFTDIKKLDLLCFSPIVRYILLRTKSQNLKFEEQKLINKLKKNIT